MAVDVSRVGVGGAPQSASGIESSGLYSPLDLIGWAVALLALAGLNWLALGELRAGDGVGFGIENGPLEDAQLVLMVPAISFFCYAGRRGQGAVGVAGLLLATAGTIAFIREIDFKDLASGHPPFEWLVTHQLQDGLFALFGTAALLYLWQKRRYFWGLVRLALRWQAWPAAVALLLLATAEFYLDGRPSTAGHFWEELVETNGYFLFAIAAWRHSRLIGDAELDRPV